MSVSGRRAGGRIAGRSAAMLGEAWTALGGDPGLLDRVRLDGDPDGLLPSALPAFEAMLASMAAASLAVAALDAARNRTAVGEVTLDAGHVAVAATSERYATRPGSDLRIGFAPLSRFWRTSDGWIRLHTNYPWHHQRAVQVLGCGADPDADAVRAAVAGWRGVDLEDALAAAGALGFAIRDLEDWRRHPQGQVVGAQALVERDPSPGRPGRPFPPGRGWRGLRVLDLTRVIAGPVATRTLAAWGADVLRVDSPHLPELPAQLIDTLAGKRSALLDLSSGPGRATLEDLLAAADVVVQGYRPGALARFGLAAGDLAERHAQLSVVTLSAWGPDGPWADRRGFDSLVQGPTGIAVAEGEGGEPGALPAQVLDHATGYLSAAAATLSMAAVANGEAPRSHGLSLARTARWLTDNPARPRPPARPLDPGPHLVTVPGPDHDVRVVRPPGRLVDLRPGWERTTAYGADPATFEPRSSRAG